MIGLALYFGAPYLSGSDCLIDFSFWCDSLRIRHWIPRKKSRAAPCSNCLTRWCGTWRPIRKRCLMASKSKFTPLDLDIFSRFGQSCVWWIFSGRDLIDPLHTVLTCLQRGDLLDAEMRHAMAMTDVQRLKGLVGTRTMYRAQHRQVQLPSSKSTN